MSARDWILWMSGVSVGLALVWHPVLVALPLALLGFVYAARSRVP